mmetsp:Transcript_118526/g.335286  ORF Transcript_118526/g.335286 Transcript_118526/m.335286 type:complete len:223 (+) Transcript_118526:673-1341(+)
MSAPLTRPGTMWVFTMPTTSGSSSSLSVVNPMGTASAVKAASVAANTVYSSLASKVSRRPALSIAALMKVKPAPDNTFMIDSSGTTGGSSKTASMICIKPFLHSTSFPITVALPIAIEADAKFTGKEAPCTVCTRDPSSSILLQSLPRLKWSFNTLARSGRASKSSRVTPSAANAASVGAKSVNGPGSSRRSPRLAFTSAAARTVISSLPRTASAIVGTMRS